MTTEEFYKELNLVDTSRESRLNLAQVVLNNLHLFPKLLEVLFTVNDKVSSRAAWVLEFVCEQYIYAMVPYLEVFTKNIKNFTLDSSVRPVAKICLFIAQTYYSKPPNPIKKTLTDTHKQRIVEACFDWLISTHKVATKVHAMEVLYFFGKEQSWIYPNLIQILEQDYQTQSAGFKARAKHILKNIKKTTK